MKHRKILFAIIIAVIALPLVVLAQSVNLPGVQLVTSFPDDWIIVTPETAAANAALLDTTPDLAEEIMRSDNIVVAAFAPGKDAALRIRMTETQTSNVYFDIERYTTEMRTAIKSDYLDAASWKITGLRFKEAVWRNPAAAGRYLRLTYNRREADTIVSRGVMAFTVHNGREITLQLQVEGRQPTAKELKIFDDWLAETKYQPQLDMPLLPSGLTFDSAVPTETMTASLKIRGKTAPNASVTASLRQGANAPFKVGEATAKASGTFTLSFDLPGEGSWGLIIESAAEGFETSSIEMPLSCNTTRIPINLSAPLEGEIWDAQPRLTGTTLSGVKMTVVDGDNTIVRNVAEGGAFNIKLSPQPEGDRVVKVTLSKKDMPDRTVTYKFTRRWNTADLTAYLDGEVKRISYANLIGNPNKYIGSIVRFEGEVLGSTYEDGRTFIRLATSNSKNRDEVCFASDDEQLVQEGSVWICYGTVTGVNYVPNQAAMLTEADTSSMQTEAEATSTQAGADTTTAQSEADTTSAQTQADTTTAQSEAQTTTAQTSEGASPAPIPLLDLIVRVQP